jgi:non-haem Fe2+, alpha-ketoglutarate-dependent halogenase
MPGSLTPAQIEQYRRDGFLSPLHVMPEHEAARLLAKLEDVERQEGGKLSNASNQKPYLLFPFLADVIRDARILDAVESLLGPNILCWAGGFFAKNPGDGKIISWHQDSTYWGLSEPEVGSVWLALTPSTVESGCMRVIPGTHTKDQLPHRDTFATNNLLSRGQEVAVEVNEAEAHDIVLRPGEMSLHHVRLVHGSAPNRSNHRRVGFVIRYIPTHIRQVAGSEDSATLVRGEDLFGNFAPEPRPATDRDPVCVAFHREMVRRTQAFLYAGAAQPGRDRQPEPAPTM